MRLTKNLCKSGLIVQMLADSKISVGNGQKDMRPRYGIVLSLPIAPKFTEAWMILFINGNVARPEKRGICRFFIPDPDTVPAEVRSMLMAAYEQQKQKEAV